MKRTLGTQLRHLIDLLDGAVEASYRDFNLDYKPRFTPVMRVVSQHQPITISKIAELAGITQPAATQTVQMMRKKELVTVQAQSDDSRKKMIHLTEHGEKVLSQLQSCWSATAVASKSLDDELPLALTELLEKAIFALEKKPFLERIRDARKEITNEEDIK